MKKSNALLFLSDLLLATLLCAGGIGSLVSGYRMNTPDFWILVSMVIWPLIGTVLSRLDRGLPIACGLGGAYLLTVSHFELFTHCKNLFLLIGRILYQGYDWDIAGIFEAAGKEAMQAPVGQAILALTMVLGLVFGFLIGRRKSIWLCLPVALAPLLLTLMVVDTVPGLIWIFIIFLGLSLLLLTQATRQQDPHQGARLTVLLLVPIALCVNLLLDGIPQASYRPPNMEGGILGFLFDRADDLPFVDVDSDGNLSLDFSGINGSQVNLGRLGPKRQSRQLALTVTTSFTGSLYLRGNSYSDYTGSHWTNLNSPDTEIFSAGSDYLSIRLDNPIFSFLPQVQSLTIETDRPRPIQFLPYYPSSQRPELEEGQLNNDRESTTYSFSMNPLDENWRNLWRQKHPLMTLGRLTNPEHFAFLQLPTDTQAWAAAFLTDTIGITEDMYPYEAADRIAEFVKVSAEYDLNTSQMPWTQDDFARWFLESAETGYCVHFATAATVLLRAAGIPARYVEGYAVSVPELTVDENYPMSIGQTVPVIESMAHAWVEYYLPDLGWVMLEATPSAAILSPEDMTPPTTGTTAPSTSTSTQPSTTRPSSSGSTTVPSQAPTASATGGDHAGTPVDLSGLWISFGCIAAIALILYLQWQLRLYWRYRTLHRGSPNRQALARWQFAQHLAKLQKAQAPSELRALAQKAKFSSHTLTAAELQQFDHYFAQSVASMKKQGLLHRALYRIVFAIY